MKTGGGDQDPAKIGFFTRRSIEMGSKYTRECEIVGKHEFQITGFLLEERRGQLHRRARLSGSQGFADAGGCFDPYHLAVAARPVLDYEGMTTISGRWIRRRRASLFSHKFHYRKRWER